MDDTSTSNVDQSHCRTPLGMNSFDQKRREQFGQKVRLAMGCFDGTSEPVKGAGRIAKDTAKRLACDCSITVNQTASGEPVDIGRKSRIWPAAMERAIKECVYTHKGDQHCVWQGCTHTHLQNHHIKHWDDGGTTCVANGVSVCSFHHTLVHEGGYTIQQRA